MSNLKLRPLIPNDMSNLTIQLELHKHYNQPLDGGFDISFGDALKYNQCHLLVNLKIIKNNSKIKDH